MIRSLYNFGAEPIWCAAILTGVGVAVTNKSHELDRRSIYCACIIALTGALVGALLWGIYDYGLAGGPFSPLASGKSFLGGLIGGALTGVAYLRLRAASVGAYGDVLVTALALGYGIGRVGCFFNGCDYGVRTTLPWGCTYPPGTEAYADHLARGWITEQALTSLPVHPVQLYAAACGFAIFLILWKLKPHWPGEKICLFAILYGTYRFGMEYLRGDFHPLLLGRSLPQIVSILLVLGGLAVKLTRRSRLPISTGFLQSGLLSFTAVASRSKAKTQLR